MRVNPIIYGFMVLGVFLGVIYGFRSAGVWSISGKVNAAGERIAPNPGDVETIKGWMTLGEIATAFNVPFSELLTQFSLPADTPADTPVKDLESENFSVSGLRDWLVIRQDTNTIPQPPNNIQPQIEATPQPTSLPFQPDPQGSAPGSADADHIPAERQVNARTTFQDLLDWDVPAETIRLVIGSDLPATGTAVKDFVTAQGQSFSGIKAALQAEVDKIER
jgi:hypothetical protein